MNTTCPSCGCVEPVSGRFFGRIGDRDMRHVFRPDGLNFLRLAGDIRVPAGEKFSACPACGLLWSLLDPSRLRNVMKKHGQTDSKNQRENKN